jgi:hypothetical protein
MSNEQTTDDAKHTEEVERVWRPSLMPAHRAPIDPAAAAHARDRTMHHHSGDLGRRRLRSYLKQPLVKAGIAISVAVAGFVAVDLALDDDWAQKSTSSQSTKKAGGRSAG